MSLDVLVVETGTANVASVLAGLRRAGTEPRIGSDPDAVRDSARVVLPGVGAFAAAVERLTERSLIEPLRARIAAGLPTLAICLGLQILFEGSEESPGVAGLGLAQGIARRFPDTVVVPQLGWNHVEPAARCRLLEPGHAYYANSYRIAAPPPGWDCAVSDHGGPFVAAMERDCVLACQFHPELSSAYGIDLLRRWLGDGGSSC